MTRRPGHASPSWGKNVLLFVADDLGRDFLGCYGNDKIKTPNLDRLANGDGGVTFTNAFASTASCSGSRSTIYTGLHTHSNGQYGLQHTYHHFMTHDHVKTLPRVFNEHGYLTGIIGKVHVGPDHVYPWTIRDESGTRNVHWAAQRAQKFFARAVDERKPFHLTVAYMDPHRDATRGGFANDDAPYDGVQDFVYDEKDVLVPPYIQDLPAVRQELKEYYRSITRMDEGVGQVLDALTQSGFLDNTLVAFVSDNGAPFINSKTTLYDAGIHLPLIFRAPSRGTAGVRCDALVSFVDLLPTFLEWAGAETPQEIQGTSFLPHLIDSQQADSQGAERASVFGSHTFHELTNYYPTRILRTKRWKYHRNICWKLDFPFAADLYASRSWQAIRNAVVDADGKQEVRIGQRALSKYVQRGPEELYDLDADPLEINDLTKDAAFADVVQQLRKELEAWQRQTQDPWLFRDGVSVRAMAQFVGQDGGWDVQDRFDFELAQPSEPPHLRTKTGL